jgi:signal transduction histidine kinase
MPKRSGVDLLREIKASNPDIQVILFTGYGQLETATKAVEYGAFAYVEKPFDSEEMLRIVRAALDKSSSERRRRELERVALESNRFETLGRLVSGMMHDMGTPLSVLNSQLELVRVKNQDAALTDRLDSMHSQVQHCWDMVRATMDYLRSEPDRNAPWRLNSVIAQCNEIANFLFREHRIEVSLQLGEALPHVAGDMMLMRQAVLNIVTNAVQAMQHQGGPRQILIETWHDDGRVHLAVGDSGPGVPAEERQKVFRTFYTTKGKAGTGLGLSVVRNIVEQMDGSVHAETSPLGGARFVVSLPSQA